MFDILRRSSPRELSRTVRHAFERDGLLFVIDAYPAHHMAELRGRYAGRTVTFIRVFDPAHVAKRGLKVRAYRDLDAHLDLVLATGRIEDDGEVTIDRMAPVAEAAVPARARRDRAAHAGDERFVFPDSVRGETL